MAHHGPPAVLALHLLLQIHLVVMLCSLLLPSSAVALTGNQARIWARAGRATAHGPRIRRAPKILAYRTCRLVSLGIHDPSLGHQDPSPLFRTGSPNLPVRPCRQQHCCCYRGTAVPVPARPGDGAASAQTLIYRHHRLHHGVPVMEDRHGLLQMGRCALW